MLVKYNLLNNPSNFKEIASSHPLEIVDDGKTLIVKGKSNWSRNFVDESSSGDIEKEKEYFIGYMGNLSGLLRFYYDEEHEYQYAEYYKDLIYGKRIISTTQNTNIFYMRLESENTELKIKKFFVTDELADIIIDKKSVQSEERQAIYPPEGHYKEIKSI